jgi:hypothetical protein
MDVIQRSALRGALGLDRGANNALLIGEAGGGWVSEEVRWMALRYGCFIGEMKEERLVKKVMNVRVNGRGDRWVRYIREVQRELQTDIEIQKLGGIGEEYNKMWKELVEKKSLDRWKDKMEKSEKRLVLYRKVVKLRGEVERWMCVNGELRVWWRRFRGGMLMGKRRENGWRDEKCEYCDNGDSVAHRVFECESSEMELMREMVIGEIESILVEGSGEELGVWRGLEEEEKLLCSLGRNFKGLESISTKMPEIWKGEWEMWN